MDAYTLLVISRSQALAKRLQSALGGDRHCIRWVPSHAQGLDLDLCPSLLVLELPPSGGIRSTLRLKRRFGVPILVLRRADQPAPPSAAGSLARPFRVQQLVHLIRTTLWSETPGIVHTGGMSLDQKARRLQIDTRFYQLPPISCQILAALMAAPGEAITREELCRHVWNAEDGDSTRALDVHISHLRRALEPDPRQPRLIITERGIGYRLEPPRQGRE